MTQPLVILGTGGGAHDLLDIVAAINAIAPRWELAGFLDDEREPGSDYLGLEILGPLRKAAHFAGCAFANAIGSDRSYRRLPEILVTTGLALEQYATLVHPASSVSTRAELGQGVVVNFGVAVGGGVVIGDHVTLGPGSIVGHDTTIEDYAIIAPGAIVSGRVRVGRNAYVGARSVIRQNQTIGEGALVGLGAVVVRDVEAEAIVIGNPARPLRSGRAPSSERCLTHA